MSSVEFALRSGEIVEIKSHELPPNGEEICSALKIEGVNLEVYGSIANLYKSTGNIRECISVIQKAIEDSESRDEPSFTKYYAILKSALILNSLRGEISEEILNEATSNLNSVERYGSSSNDPHVLQSNLLKVLVYYHRGLYDLCEAQLRTLTSTDGHADNFLYHLLAGIVKMKSNDYIEGLKSLIESFKIYPWCPTMILIGDCWNHLGYLEKSMDSLRIAVDLCTDRQMKLFISSKMTNICSKIPMKNFLFEALNIYLALVNNANEVDFHSICLMADHFFYRKQYEKCLSLINYALKNESNLSPSLLSYVYYIQAKLNHASNNLEEAYVNYMTSLRHQSDFWPSVAGLAKIYTCRRDVNSAINFLEKLPSNLIDSSLQKLIFLIYTHKYLDSKNSKYLILARNAANSGIDSFQSIQLYQQLIRPNIDMRENLDDNSFYSFNHASLSSIFDSTPFKFSSSDFEDVAKFNFIVTDISCTVSDHLLPGNPDFVLLTGYKYLFEGSISKAMDVAKELAGTHEDDPQGWFLLADCQYAQKAYVPCRKTLERVLQKINKHNEIALVKLGALYVDFARSSKKSGDVKSMRAHYKRSMEFFAKTLTINALNMYAAIGVAVVLAENGDHVSAKELFDGVRGVTCIKPELEVEACLGAANCLLNTSPQNDNVIFGCFHQALKKVDACGHSKETFKQKIHLFFAKAYFVCGIALGQLKYIEKSRDLLSKIDDGYIEKATVKIDEAILIIGGCEIVMQNEAYHTLSTVEESLVKIQLSIDILDGLKDQKFKYEHLVPKYLKEAAKLKQELTEIHTKLATGTKIKSNYLEEIQKQRELVLKQQEEEQVRLEEEKRRKTEEIERQRRVLAEKVKDMRVTSKIDIASEEEEDMASGAEDSSKKRKSEEAKSPRKRKSNGPAPLSDDFVFSSGDEEEDIPNNDEKMEE